MNQHTVFVTEDAQADLQDIYDYVAQADAPLKAEQLLAKLEVLVLSLENFPQRGSVTKEL